MYHSLNYIRGGLYKLSNGSGGILGSYTNTVVTIIITGIVTALLTISGFYISTKVTEARNIGILENKVQTNIQNQAEIVARVRLLESRYDELVRLAVAMNTKLDLLMEDSKNGREIN